MASRSFERYAGLIKSIMQSESLDELPEATPGLERTSFFSRVLKAESLPLDEPVAGGRRSPRSSGLFSSEPLPFDGAGEFRSGRASFLATILSREPLPVDPVPGPGPADRDLKR